MHLPRRYSKLVIVLIILTFSCCSTTGPSKSDLILQQLLAIPSLSPPTRTSENIGSPGFIKADSTHVKALARLDTCYTMWIQSFQENQVEAKRDESTYRWIQRPAPLGYTGIILSVTPGDTLQFQLELELYQSPNNLIIQGWVIPSRSMGFVSDSRHTWQWRWESNETNRAVKYVVPSFYGDGLHISVIDSIAGGGLIDIWDYRHQITANWDLHGHGSWWEYPGDYLIEW